MSDAFWQYSAPVLRLPCGTEAKTKSYTTLCNTDWLDSSTDDVLNDWWLVIVPSRLRLAMLDQLPADNMCSLALM